MSAPSLDTAIQSLPPELREMILKEVITAKVKEREEMGWSAVHKELATMDTQKKIRCLLCADRMLLRREVQSPTELADICSDCMFDCISLQEVEEGNVAEIDPRWLSWL